MTPTASQNRRALGDEIFTDLRRSILRGDLTPGERLVEEKTAAQFGASRTPVREAFLRLEQDGLVERRATGGYVVGRVDLKEMEEILDMRAVLEGHAAALAARRRTDDLVQRLTGMLDTYEQALRRGEMERLIEINTRFHDLLYQVAGSRRLTRAIEDLRDYIYRFRRHILCLPGMAEQSHRDHCQMVEAISRGDAAQAELVVREHIHRSRRSLKSEAQAGRLGSYFQGAVSKSPKARILVAKPGLDGHDRGAKVVAFALRDAGFEVIYTGLHQTVESIVATAVQEAVDVIGLSIMSGAHLPICRKLAELCRQEGLDDVILVVGGVIPKEDIPKLNKIGIHGVFPGGTPFGEFIGWLKDRTGV